jgi:hypothetical protein
MLDKHNLFGSSMHRLDNNVASSNGGMAVPSVILGQARWMESTDDDGESWEEAGTHNTNITSGGRNRSVDLTVLSTSITSLGDKALSAAKLQVQELEKNCGERQHAQMHEACEKEKTRKHEASERKKDCVHQRTQSIEDRISTLKVEKRKLAKELLLAERSDNIPPKKKAMTDLLEEQIQDVLEEIAHQTAKLDSLTETPQRTNRIPDSAVHIRPASL